MDDLVEKVRDYLTSHDRYLELLRAHFFLPHWAVAKRVGISRIQHGTVFPPRPSQRLRGWLLGASVLALARLIADLRLAVSRGAVPQLVLLTSGQYMWVYVVCEIQVELYQHAYEVAAIRVGYLRRPKPSQRGPDHATSARAQPN